MAIEVRSWAEPSAHCQVCCWGFRASVELSHVSYGLHGNPLLWEKKSFPAVSGHVSWNFRLTSGTISCVPGSFYESPLSFFLSSRIPLGGNTTLDIHGGRMGLS